MHRARDLLTSLLLCVCLPAVAQATSTVDLHARFVPERLGQNTTLEFSARISSADGYVTPPLTELDVRYPQDIGISAGELGLETCARTTLEVLGPEGCPADSRMGEGSAIAEVPIGPHVFIEEATVTILRAPEESGHLALLLFANGLTPVYAQIATTGLLLPATVSYGGSVDITVPLIPGLPGGPDVSLVQLNATLGPLGLTYYEHVHGRLVAYKPRGILLPRKCPRHGFAFSANFTFLDSSHTSANTSVPCPPRHGGDATERAHAASSS
ncbi:MAG TPA: hypothetical protein VN845_07465 [Solirubrobacteraceae bacterium]|nr:hypothetical protein [Solirubrobacteraceae bacterium]